MGKLNPLGGTDFTDTDMVKVATHTGNPRNGGFQVYKGLASTLSSMALMGCLRLQTALCVAAKWLCGASPVGKVARSSAVPRIDWGRPSADTGSVLALGITETKSRRV